MRFSVEFEDGVWSFTVESDEDGGIYAEEFELTDLNEARDTAWDLIEEISREEDFPPDLLEDLNKGYADE